MYVCEMKIGKELRSKTTCNSIAHVTGKKSKVLVAQSCPILCNPMNCSPLGSSAHGIHQVRIMEWVAIPFSRGSSQTRDGTRVFHTAGRFFTI